MVMPPTMPSVAMRDILNEVLDVLKHAVVMVIVMMLAEVVRNVFDEFLDILYELIVPRGCVVVAGQVPPEVRMPIPTVPPMPPSSPPARAVFPSVFGQILRPFVRVIPVLVTWLNLNDRAGLDQRRVWRVAGRLTCGFPGRFLQHLIRVVIL